MCPKLVTDPAALPSVLDWGVARDLVTPIVEYDQPLRERPELFWVNGAPVWLNRGGTMARLYRNGSRMDVNFPAGDPGIAAPYPDRDAMPHHTAVSVEFDAPVAGVGVYLTLLGDQEIHDHPKDLLAIMYYTLADGREDRLMSRGMTGRTLLPGSARTAPFIGVDSEGGSPIARIAFDASIFGNFWKIVISNLCWKA